ncbi:M48 family metallopeptidase [Actinoallomurus bryophytorum]|uniref:STE24 endopeptidase n=1 Tax=Actinoallomurus bryophytorum TaxID=1490222 RepID=A0A543CCA7_9ACTN|nr:M48 family metallopeptidase [Actinoallomurus bryophytorum]TQL94705.1 STE24 endopeptidase [Actinoallomurus bryophytorum]
MSEENDRQGTRRTDEAGDVTVGSHVAAGAEAVADARRPAVAGDRASRRAAAVAAVVLGALLAVVVAVTTPWHPLPGADRGPDPALDFTPAEIARSHAFNAALNPPAYAGLIAGIVVVVLLGLTPLGSRLLGAVTGPLRRWPLRLVGAAVVLAVLTRLAGLPFDVWSETVLRRYGLSTEHWGGWARDQVTSLGVTLVIWIIVVLGLHLLIRRFPRRWWAGAAAGGFVLVAAASFGYPVLVEPLFNSFHSMPAGPLRTDLLRLAREDGVPVDDVLVADASKRTTTLNAYVSGFGSTRRIVVYDTLLDSEPRQEVELVVAHELGHAKRGDVLHGTLVGALGVAAGVCVLYLVMSSPRLLRRAGAESAADPRSVALLLAGVTVLLQLSAPVENLVSRHIEARADMHALDLTRDPATYVRMQRSLSARNLDELSPDALEYALWNTHPTGPERIAMGREWARLHHLAVPAPLVAKGHRAPP